MVAERSVNLRRLMVTFVGKIRSDNIGMSSDKQCEKHCHLKFEVSDNKVNPFRFSRSLKEKRRF